ncbi:MAG: hypothetical protein KC620_09660 [Myxococcales bacterium]|nr:hypothetical protein [Myxococcales bacterium]
MSYEFNREENRTIGALADKMGIVGLFFWLCGLAILLVGALGLAPLFAPTPEMPTQVPAEIADAVKGGLDQLRTGVETHRTEAWYGGIAAVIQGLIFIAAGLFTRRSAKYFRRIVQTAGDDLAHLMDALVALRGFFGLISTLLVLGLLLALGAAGFSLWTRYG